MKRHSQQGSALLIVLGFLSFMVVSAVAFAIWMRTERVPSSALRRNVANRYLVKAALAQAMSRVDDAIRSHPYPGACNTNDQNAVYHDGNGSAYDWWESRVFMPPNPTPEDGGATRPGDSSSRFAPISKTVSVLNLEALGYLPPGIANDVRLLSRSSWAAKWDYFNFDAGRYAFCAVNVSDMLDINKISADSPRTSAAAARFDPNAGGDKKPPASRYSLAYLFRRDDANFSSVSVPSEFDKIIHERNGLDWPEAPLISLMDYNLALGDRQYGGLLWSPFYYLISGKNTSGNLYSGSEAESGNVRGARRQPFITDSWFPQNGNVTSIKQYDIGQYQPFDITERTSLKDVERKMRVDNQFWVKTYREGYVFCRLDPLMLSDYLDVDNVPLSLAMPCVERVPMITTLGPVGNELKMEFLADEKPSKTDTTNTEKLEYYDVKVKVTPPRLSSGLLFPFKNGSGDDSRKFTVEALMRLAFVDEEKEFNTETLKLGLRNSEFAQALRPQDESEWKEVADGKQFVSPSDNKACMLLTLFGTTAVKDDVLDVQNVREMIDGDNMHSLGTPAPSEGTILQKIKVTKLKEGKDGNMVEDPDSKPTWRYQILLPPLRKNGTVLDVSDKQMEETEFNSFCAEHNIRPYLVSWTRVKDDEGKTVDMVPATYQDDVLNGISNDAGEGPEIAEYLGNDEANGQPILYFSGKTAFTYANAVAQGATTFESAWLYKSCYAVDPRYNWAPENWWFSENEDPTVQNWYKAVFNEGGILDTLAKDDPGNVSENPRGDRARDPFLFVSNSGYLQSLGELAFLPHLSEIENTTESESVLNVGAYKGKLHKVEGGNYDDLKTMPCARAAWRSYPTYRTNPNGFEFGANFYRRGLLNAPQGFYVNPFTQEREVMLAAVAHTPLNYWVAGTNDTGKVKGKKKREKFDAADTFDADTRYRSDYLAEYMMHRFEDLSRMMTFNGDPRGEEPYMIRKVWEDMFDALDWAGRRDPGTSVETIYKELNDYLTGGGGVSNYKDMYLKKNGYGALNRFVTGDGRPPIILEVGRAIHGGEYADPLRYYNNRTDPSKDPRSDNYISDVDRMFLHSYWRDCFANRQQLFLIFVRAESTALGGAGEGTPAQQGGRAVALVWRDPGPPTGSDVRENEQNGYIDKRHPHKMRILFYRQFD